MPVSFSALEDAVRASSRVFDVAGARNRVAHCGASQIVRKQAGNTSPRVGDASWRHHKMHSAIDRYLP